MKILFLKIAKIIEIQLFIIQQRNAFNGLNKLKKTYSFKEHAFI